jgi:dTDP-4-dehydrorhamnose reductase
LKILLFGGSGQVGKELQRVFSGLELVAVPREECDLREASAIDRIVQRETPHLILNAAAYTAVDAAESDQENCFAINARAPRVMAAAAARIGATLVHYSTDYVFDGSKNSPYSEDDEINPLNQYGRSKADGEVGILGTGARAFILRTSWVYSPHGKNFLKTMLRMAQESERLRIVSDQIGAPTSAYALANATFRMFEGSAQNTSSPGGVYHLTAEGYASWAQFAREIFRLAKLHRSPSIEEISSEEFLTPARRPKNSRLATDKFAASFGFRLPTWQEQLRETLAALNSLA